MAGAKRPFGDGCAVRLFGSRTDDRRRGGDTDLHIEAEDAVATLASEIAFDRLAHACPDDPGRQAEIMNRVARKAGNLIAATNGMLADAARHGGGSGLAEVTLRPQRLP